MALTVEPGRTYEVKVIVRNNSTKGGVPSEAILGIGISAGTTEYTIIAPRVDRKSFTAGQTLTFNYTMSIPTGLGGLSGLITVWVETPDGVGLVSAIEYFDIHLPFSIQGKVFDIITNAPLSDVAVTLDGIVITRTDSSGKYSFGEDLVAIYGAAKKWSMIKFEKLNYGTITRNISSLIGDNILDIGLKRNIEAYMDASYGWFKIEDAEGIDIIGLAVKWHNATPYPVTGHISLVIKVWNGTTVYSDSGDGKVVSTKNQDTTLATGDTIYVYFKTNVLNQVMHSKIIANLRVDGLNADRIEFSI